MHPGLVELALQAEIAWGPGGVRVFVLFMRLRSWNAAARCRGEAKSWPYRPKGCAGWVPGIASRAGGAGLTGRNRTGGPGAFARLHTSCVSDLDMLPVPVHLRRCCVSGLKGQLYQPGMKCQVSRPRSVVALQGQLSAGPCRVMVGSRGERRGGAMVGLLVPGRALVAAAQVPVSTRTPTRTRQSRATRRRVAGARLRAGPTGRRDARAAFPGLHPGLVELALQAGIAKGRSAAQWRAVDVNRPVMAPLKVPCTPPAPGPNASPDREGGGHRRSSPSQPIQRFMAQGAMHLAMPCTCGTSAFPA